MNIIKDNIGRVEFLVAAKAIAASTNPIRKALEISTLIESVSDQDTKGYQLATVEILEYAAENNFGHFKSNRTKPNRNSVFVFEDFDGFKEFLYKQEEEAKVIEIELTPKENDFIKNFSGSFEIIRIEKGEQAYQKQNFAEEPRDELHITRNGNRQRIHLKNINLPLSQDSGEYSFQIGSYHVYKIHIQCSDLFDAYDPPKFVYRF